jgi:hypothetical protein
VPLLGGQFGRRISKMAAKIAALHLRNTMISRLEDN